MKMSEERYTWHRIHKTEENLERQITEWVEEHIQEWFGVDDTNDLTEEQIDEVIKFRDEDLNEVSPMQWGYSNIISAWENNQWEESQECD